MATGESAGHGLTLNLGVVDEAFDNDGRSEQAMGPAMMTKRDAQMWIVSTAGTSESTWFNEKTDAGRAAVERGATEGVCYLEWSADPSADPGSEETWRSCMPALGYTVDVETVRSNYESMALADFKRAFLNIRLDKRESAPWKVFGEHEWSECGSRDREIGFDSPVVFGLEVPASRESACLAVAGRDDSGRPQVEVVDNRGGTAWVVERVVGMASRFPSFGGVVIDRGAPAATFIDELRAEGVDVVDVGGDDHALFAQRFLDAVRTGAVTHRSQGSLDAAVAGAVTRSFGDRWLWSRRDRAVDVGPLVAATLAFGVLETRVPAGVAAPVFAY
jgi:hypothetical protein